MPGGGAAAAPSYRGSTQHRALLGGQPGPLERGWTSSSSSSFSPLAAQASASLAGVSVLLVAHEGPMVAQDVHGVLPVPAGAAVVLEAGLRVNKANRDALSRTKINENSHVEESQDISLSSRPTKHINNNRHITVSALLLIGPETGTIMQVNQYCTSIFINL